jgi:hypothetical protein
VRSDGRVDVTAAEAWPDRLPPEPPLSREELALGCAAYAACTPALTEKGDAGAFLSSWRPLLQVACLAGAPSAFAPSAAERVIPLQGYDESFNYLMHGILDGNGSCSRIAELLTANATSLSCQEDGCWSTRFAAATCNGDVATLGQNTRDCSRSHTRCSEQSPTGCTDRLLVRCKSGALDRCDGTVKLGCDDCGFVSFHDCSWNGGACVESKSGASCVPPADATSCSGMPTDCSGSSLSLCVSGQPVTVDCEALGMKGCRTQNELRIDAGAAPYTNATCEPFAADAGVGDAGANR